MNDMNNLINNNVKDIAIIYKMKVNFNDMEYIPYKVVTGIYNEYSEDFVDEKGTPYRHIIEGDTYGFGGRKSLEEYNKQFPLLPLPILKALILNASRKIKYRFSEYGECYTPIINVCKKNSYGNENIYLDRDVLSFYITYYPDIFPDIEKQYGIEISFYQNANKDTNSNQNTKSIVPSKQPAQTNINVKELYTEITKNVIDQNEPIMKILTAIWKQYNNFSPNKSRNILINGSTGVGKTEIFRQLTKRINVPCYIANATEYTASGYVGKDVSEMLKSLLDITDGNLEKAERGILIIDELDKLAETNKAQSQVNQKDVQEALLKIVEDGKYDVMWQNNKYTFDTSKLMIVGMGSWSRIELPESRALGFERVSTPKKYKDLTTEDFVKNGMIPELIGRFPVIVQMNELNSDSYKRIIKSENSVLNTNQIFLEKQGIMLTITEEAIDEIALTAERTGFGARSLDTIIETTLSEASFEIASNPELYKELIITPETIKNNKAYTLVRKK